MPLKIGAVIPQGWLGDLPAQASEAELRKLMVESALRLEKAGLYSGWLYDHFHPFTVPEKVKSRQPVLECWTSLAYLSQVTGRLKLGPLVTCQSYRLPSILAKMAATIDQISRGRLEFGIGAGWYEEEYKAYGFEFPKLSVRVKQLEEAVQIVRKMWTEKQATFQGQYYRVQGALCEPKPFQKPHPKIMIGGESERTLSVVAKYGDRCNFSGGPENYQKRIALLEKICSGVGRRIETVEKTLHTTLILSESEAQINVILRGLYKDRGRKGESFDSFTDRVRNRAIVGRPVEVVEQIEAYRKLGVGYIIFYIRDLVKLKFAPLVHLAKIVSSLS